ncbi:MAG: class I SAM-dependent methyltransferase [Anaerolineae bacterium]|nr:class I SAM-dependent methyltransferase [Anaerolineae bacterium]
MTTPNWFLNEIMHAGDEHLDAAYVPSYDAKAGTDPADDLAVLRTLGLNETHTLIDLGAGTGTLALAAARACRRVIAVDVSQVMLGVLQAKMAETGIDNIERVQSGFLSYEHEGEPVDFVYSRHALHHLPDFWKALALRRIAMMLKAGGVFYLRDLIFSFAPEETEKVIGEWLANAAESPDKGWTKTELIAHLQTEHSTYHWLLEAMLEKSGFAIQQVEHGATRVHSAYTCVKMG